MKNFDVKRIGKEAVVVRHPLGGPGFYSVESESFWERDVEEQRQSAVEMYIREMDRVKSDPMEIAQMREDAGDTFD